MAFQKYEGNDKYHFRYYRKSVNHPFLVVLVTSVEEEDEKAIDEVVERMLNKKK